VVQAGERAREEDEAARELCDSINESGYLLAGYSRYPAGQVEECDITVVDDVGYSGEKGGFLCSGPDGQMVWLLCGRPYQGE